MVSISVLFGSAVGPGPYWLISNRTAAGSTDPSAALTDAQNRRSARRVLVVDDERLIAETLAEILEAEGFEVRVACSGSDAVEAAQTMCPDILIADVLMPDMNGVETAIAIRSICPATQILLFSGQAATSDILNRARSEGHHFQLLPKPIHPMQLLSAIDKLV